jgi:hypothetical protein
MAVRRRVTLTPNAHSEVEQAMADHREVSLTFSPHHGVAKIKGDGTDAAYEEITVHRAAHGATTAELAARAARGVGFLSLALVGITAVLIVVLQMLVLANEIWGSGRPLPAPAFIEWELVKFMDGYVPTFFVVPRAIVYPRLSAPCADVDMDTWARLASGDNVDGTVAHDYKAVARDILGHAMKAGCMPVLTLEQIRRMD